MEFQFGNNPEFTIGAFCTITGHSGEVTFPLSIAWWYMVTDKETKNFNLTVRILCFGFRFEIWRWGNV